MGSWARHSEKIRRTSRVTILSSKDFCRSSHAQILCHMHNLKTDPQETATTATLNFIMLLWLLPGAHRKRYMRIRNDQDYVFHVWVIVFEMFYKHVPFSMCRAPSQGRTMPSQQVALIQLPLSIYIVEFTTYCYDSPPSRPLPISAGTALYDAQRVRPCDCIVSV